MSWHCSTLYWASFVPQGGKNERKFYKFHLIMWYSLLGLYYFSSVGDKNVFKSCKLSKTYFFLSLVVHQLLPWILFKSVLTGLYIYHVNFCYLMNGRFFFLAAVKSCSCFSGISACSDVASVALLVGNLFQRIVLWHVQVCL